MTNEIDDLTSQLEKAVVDTNIRAFELYLECQNGPVPPLAEQARAEEECDKAVRRLYAHREKIAPKAESIAEKFEAAMRQPVPYEGLSVPTSVKPSPSKIAECRPPSEHEGERWHWVNWKETAFPCYWADGHWELDGSHYTPREAGARGMSYHSVAKPSPVEPQKPTYAMADELAELLAALQSWRQTFHSTDSREVLGVVIAMDKFGHRAKYGPMPKPQAEEPQTGDVQHAVEILRQGMRATESCESFVQRIASAVARDSREVLGVQR